MTNIALGKKVLEKWSKSDVITNGELICEKSKDYAEAIWPKCLTLDLEKNSQIETIRFWLYDRDSRGYKYRLLTSEDSIIWTVHYETGENDYKGWQEFNFPNKINARYIRLHCLYNSRNQSFHIIELQVYDKDTDILDTIITNKKEIFDRTDKTIIEKGTSLPITEELDKLTQSLTNLIENSNVLDKSYFNNILKDLKIRTNDIERIEGNIESIKRVFLRPVQNELVLSKKLGIFSKYSFWLGIIAFIITLVITSFTTYYNYLANKEIKSILNKNTNINKSNDNITNSFSFLTNEEFNISFEQNSQQLDSLKYKLSEELPYNCFNNSNEYKEIVTNITNSNGFDTSEIMLLKGAFFYCIEQYNYSEKILSDIKDTKLETDKYFLLSIIYSKTGQYDKLESITKNKFISESWLNVNKDTILRTFENIKMSSEKSHIDIAILNSRKTKHKNDKTDTILMKKLMNNGYMNIKILEPQWPNQRIKKIYCKNKEVANSFTLKAIRKIKECKNVQLSYFKDVQGEELQKHINNDNNLDILIIL